MRDIYRQPTPAISFEIFPPKSEQGDVALYQHLDRLAARSPAFISCTYGAGGSTRSRTLDICSLIQTRWNQVATAHFTCVGSSREQLQEWLALADVQGVRNIMALRGDPPQGDTEFRPAPGGLKYANELVALIRDRFPEHGVGVAGYPEKHPEAPDHDSDLSNLRRKVDAGADAVFTQLFYVNEVFLRFRDRADRAGIQQPIIPGIMPITEAARIKRIVQISGTAFPEELAAKLDAAGDDLAAQFEIGVEAAVQQCRELLDAGVPGIHFYVLNKADAVERILDGLGLCAAQPVS